jgi:hypothetical protein
MSPMLVWCDAKRLVQPFGYSVGWKHVFAKWMASRQASRGTARPAGRAEKCNNGKAG